MKNYVIMTDSACSLDKAMLEKLDVEYIKMTVSDADGEYLCSLEWDEFSPKQYYDKMRAGVLIKTAQIPPAIYEERFEKLLKAGADILSVSVSSALSGSAAAAAAVGKSLSEKYPGRKIICVDTLNSTLGLGLLVYHASRLRDEGKTIEEAAEWLESNKLNVHQIATVDDLVYLKRAGRVTGLVTMMSKIFKIKPIIISDVKGQNKSILKVKGRTTSLKTLVNLTKENIINPKEQTVFVSHADCEPEALMVKDWLLKEIKCKDVYISSIDPTCGASAGPGMLGIYFYGKKVTE